MCWRCRVAVGGRQVEARGGHDGLGLLFSVSDRVVLGGRDVCSIDAGGRGVGRLDGAVARGAVGGGGGVGRAVLLLLLLLGGGRVERLGVGCGRRQHGGRESIARSRSDLREAALVRAATYTWAGVMDRCVDVWVGRWSVGVAGGRDWPKKGAGERRSNNSAARANAAALARHRQRDTDTHTCPHGDGSAILDRGEINTHIQTYLWEHAICASSLVTGLAGPICLAVQGKKCRSGSRARSGGPQGSGRPGVLAES